MEAHVSSQMVRGAIRHEIVFFTDQERNFTQSLWKIVSLASVLSSVTRNGCVSGRVKLSEKIFSVSNNILL